MRCPQCRQDNPAGAKFCAGCGGRLEAVCSACGHPNLPGSRFCNECGKPVNTPSGAAPTLASPQSYTPRYLAEKILTSRHVLEGERKQVTVLFADIKGSMELLADRDPEEARKILDPVLEHMMGAVHRYEGTVNQVMGDGIMALFGAPLAHEDHAVRACYAALAMQQAMRRYTEEVRRDHGIEVQVRIGLNSGEVVVRTIGSDLRMDYSAVGQTTHLAARMEHLAPGGLFLNHGIVDLEPAASALPRWLSSWIGRWSSFIETYVFPDGELVAPADVLAPATTAGFELRDVESLREHYAHTLRHWVRRLEARHDEAAGLVGEPTYRVWRAYMAGCAHAFASGRIGVMQTLLAKRDENGVVQLPPTRADLYARHPPATGVEAT